MNKSENISEEQKEKLHQEIRQINPFANIDFVKFGDASLIQLNSFQQIQRSVFNFVSLPATHSHIQTKTLRLNEAIKKDEFLHWLSYTLDVHKSQIYRTKGILCFEDEPYEFILQGVGGSFEISEGDLILEEAKSELVFIGNLKDVVLEF